MSDASIHQTFRSALDALVEQVKGDRSILAAVLCGSLSHDTVWAKSDIDLVLVTVDDRKVERSDVALYADGINVHALLVPRGEFRKTVEGAFHSSFVHSFLAKGTLLYTHDPSIADVWARLRDLGARDLRLQRLEAGVGVLACMYKARKWFLTRGDLDYTALWLLYAATPLAQVEVLGAGLLMDREVIPQALLLNPAFFTIVYTDLLNSAKTRRGVEAALETAERYIAERAPDVFAPVLEYLREVGEPRSAGEIEFHFARSFNVSGVTVACEYLADQRLIRKASTAVRLTKKSNVAVQELAFFSGSEARDAT